MIGDGRPVRSTLVTMRATKRRSGVRFGLAVAAVAVVFAGCGGGDEHAAVPAPASTTDAATTKSEDRPSASAESTVEPPADAASPAGPGADGERGRESPTATAAPACRYRAPPGRLAEDVVPIQLAAATCDEGTRLAMAAALGQPAGANITVRRDGFLCEPSTEDRGRNVLYSCMKGAQRVSFPIEWSAEP